MNTPRYVMGIDFGTLSARSVLINLQTGQELSGILFSYPHGVLDRVLPGTDIPVGSDAALQHPEDYRNALEFLLEHTWKKAGIPPQSIVAIGTDFTSCTMLPVDENMQPLCTNPLWKENPHSWVKLWKHHGAQEQADRIRMLAEQWNLPFLHRYGGRPSSEWFFPKMLETYEKARPVYDATYRFVNAGDWVTYLMTGKLTASASIAGFHCFWSDKDGFPPQDYLEALSPGFGTVLRDKMTTLVTPICTPAGFLTEEMAQKTGLTPGIVVAPCVVDSHSALPSAGVKESGGLLLSMGTSLCQIMISRQEALLPGICGVVHGGTHPGYFGYEAGQAAVGDIYDWFVRTLINPQLQAEADAAGISVFDCLAQKAARLRPGESGLLALDWWNGNRSILSSTDVSGLIVGLNLNTRPEEIYRALVEATAFGTRTIVENFESHGATVSRIYACGGLANKSPLVMQIYADILGRDIYVSESKQAAACGCAIHAAVALGKDRGGFDTMEDAVTHLVSPPSKCWHPTPAHREIYNKLFGAYTALHDFFGRTHPELMKNLKQWRKSV